jgi:ribosome-associated protein
VYLNAQLPLETFAELMHICRVQVLCWSKLSDIQKKGFPLKPITLKREFTELDPRCAQSAEAAPVSLARIVTDALENAKAEDIVTLDLAGKTCLGDYMIVASGRSQRHVGAVAEQLIEKLKFSGVRDVRVEGMPLCDWVLVDAGDVIVHVFRPEARAFYNIEKMWASDRPKLEATG